MLTRVQWASITVLSIILNDHQLPSLWVVKIRPAEKKNIASLGHDSSLRPEAPAPVAPMANGGSHVGTSRGTDR